MGSVFLVSLIPMTMWGLSDFFSERFSKSISPYAAHFIINIGSFPLAFAASALNGTQISGNWDQVAQMAGVSFLFVTAYVALMKALEIGPAGIAATTANSYVLVTVLLGVIFGLEITILIILGALLVFIGGALLSAENTSQKITFFTSKAFRVALISVASWGLAFFLIDSIDRINWSDQNLVITTVSLFSILLVMKFTSDSPTHTLALMFQKNNLAMWLPGITASAGLLGFFAATSLGDSVIIPAVVASASPVITTILAAILSKEKLLRINIIGIVIVVAGVMMLNAG